MNVIKVQTNIVKQNKSFDSKNPEPYLLLGAGSIRLDIKRGSAWLERGVGLGTACRTGRDDAQHFLLNHTCSKK